jgi:hypothetical protein
MRRFRSMEKAMRRFPWVMACAALLTTMAARPFGLTEADQPAYQRYLNANLPRALAISPDGIGWSGDAGTIEAARAQALAACAGVAGHPCALYAENLETVWPSARRAPPPAPPSTPLISGPGYGFVADARYIWHGPASARGVYVWSHGFDGGDVDNRGRQPPSHVRAFNNAGFDIVRFDRDPAQDHQRDVMADALRQGLAELRRRGWRQIVASGESRGGWNSLQALASPGTADVVIAFSPAAHGDFPGDLVLVQQTDLWQLLHDARSPAARVAFVQFCDDPYSAAPEQRLALLDAQLRPRVGRLLVIDRPAGFSGHYASAEPEFAAEYADCLLHFALDARPPSACGTP